MDSIINWFRTHDFQISWFLVGFLTSASLNEFGRGNWGWGLVYLAIALTNAIFSKVKISQ